MSSAIVYQRTVISVRYCEIRKLDPHCREIFKAIAKVFTKKNTTSM
jgi:hypothetical protein